MDRLQLRQALLDQALQRGFVAAGVAGVRPFRLARARALQAVAEGRMEGMPWYDAHRVEGITDPAGPHPWARSLLALAWPCPPAPEQPPADTPGRPRGRISSYACLPGGDYHDVLAAACDDLGAWLCDTVPGARFKRFVDHGWAMDRAVAERAGIGFAGKHASIITRAAGSYVLLAEMLLSVSLPPTPPSRRSCGQCFACGPACPTGAIVSPGVIDARRCISYLTIEHRGAIAEELRPLMGTWAFGCDLCQEACPINQRLSPAPLAGSDASVARGPVPFPDLVECLQLSDDEFRARFRHTAVWRTGRAGLARNAAIALGNAGDPAAVPALRAARDGDPDPVVRDAAQWAMARLGA